MLETIKPQEFHKTAVQILKCGSYMVTGDSGSHNNHVIAWITRVSINPPILSVAVDRTQYDVDLLENSNTCTIHIFSEKQIEEEKKLLREIYRRNNLNQEKIVVNNSDRLHGRCAILTCNKIDKLHTDSLNVYLASVVFSKIDHTKKPLYLNL